MNIVLLEIADFIGDKRIALSGRRAHHIVTVLRSQVGDCLQVGLLNGDLGTGIITEITNSKVELEVTLDRHSPSPLPIRLLLALPRPKVLRRTLSAAITMGVKEVYIFNSWRVEKSYWQTPWLKENELREIVLLALEQAGDTRLPEIFLKKRFRPFVEDEVPHLAQDRDAWLLHPHAENSLREISGRIPALIAIGPEGGFIPFEVEMLMASGLTSLSLGSRILRVEQAVSAVLGNFVT